MARHHRQAADVGVRELNSGVKRKGKAAEQPGHFLLGFGFVAYRNRDTLEILMLGYTRAFSIPLTAMSRRRSASKVARVLIPSRPSLARSFPISLPFGNAKRIDLTVQNVTMAKPQRQCSISPTHAGSTRS